MFLLPGIGAWISDALILYIYFTHGDINGNVPKSNASGWASTGFVVIGNDESHSPFDNEIGDSHVRNSVSSPPNSLHQGNLIGIEIKEDIAVSSTESSSSEQHLLSLDNESKDELPANNTSYYLLALYNESKDEPPYNNTSIKDKVKLSAATVESKTGYIAVLAIVRMVLLTFPLSYAAWSGTRVPCVVVQYMFHAISALIVICHMLAVLTLDQTGVVEQGNSLDPGTTDPTDGVKSLSGVTDESSSAGEGWTLLSLSLVSIMLHCLIILHVRSSGPIQDGLYEEKRKRKRLAYAMAFGSNRFTIDGKGGRLSNGQKINGHEDDDDDENQTSSRFLLPGGVNNSTGNISLKERLMCLPGAFLNDTQARFDAAQQMWSERLEMMTQSLHQNSMNISTDRQHRGEGLLSQSSPPRHLESTNLITHAINTAASNASKLAKPDPFRVLLQLFAYEDVWSGTNNRLDLAFSAGPAIDGTKGSQSNDGDFVSSEGSAALAFYAPQLLSFLLHGAYFDISSKLEEWILKKCGQDLHFAHRCFWFLRSWCLGCSSNGRKPSNFQSLSSHGSFGGLASLIDFPLEPVGGLNNIRGVESNLYLSSCQGSLPDVPLYSPPSAAGIDPPGLSAWDNYSGTDGYGDSTTSKFLPDEQELIEQLLHRVVEQGCRPATAAQYGSVDGQVADDFDSCNTSNCFSYSPSALATAMEQGLIPVDPRTGSHSIAHLDCITSSHNHGFLPLNSSGEPHQKSNSSNDENRLFFAAPLFLDALLSVADDLMNISRPNRTAELRQRLRSLEVELLPSNVVYLPIKNMDHRVWRIVSDESLALSTNERVPCIVTLEVIDYGVSGPSNVQPSNVCNESIITSAWVSTPRQPHRHSTLIDKVANYTQEGLKRLEDTIDHLSHHGDGKSGVLDSRLSEFLGMRDNSWSKSTQLYSSVSSYDDGEDDDNHDDELHYHGQDDEAPAVRGLGESKQLTEKEFQSEEDIVSQLCPPQPIGSPLLSDRKDETPPIPRSSPTFNTPNNEDVQKSPMGQWSTPNKRSLILTKRQKGGIPIPELEDIESDDDHSPQAKHRKQVIFPPSTTAILHGDSFGDEPRMNNLAEPADKDMNILKTVTPAVVFKEDWRAKTERLRRCSVYGSHPGWRLLPILIKSNDDLRQEQLASQLIQRMATILAKARVPVWIFPYEIVALTSRGGSK
jgi:hypothetical protein